MIFSFDYNKENSILRPMGRTKTLLVTRDETVLRELLEAACWQINRKARMKKLGNFLYDQNIVEPQPQSIPKTNNLQKKHLK